MYWSGFDADTNQKLLEEAGFRLDSAKVRTQTEGDTEVRFLWVEATADSRTGPQQICSDPGPD